MKKILIIYLLLSCFSNTFARTIRSSHRATTHRVSTTRSYSTPKITSVKPKTTFTHKSAVKQTISTRPNYNTQKAVTNNNIKNSTPKLTTFTSSSIKRNNPIDSKKTSFTNDNFSNYDNRNTGLNFTDYMILNSIFNNKNNNNQQPKEIDLRKEEISDEEMIELLEIAIKREKEKFSPDKEKINKYENMIKKLKR